MVNALIELGPLGVARHCELGCCRDSGAQCYILRIMLDMRDVNFVRAAKRAQH
jgi:hypothetical protein